MTAPEALAGAARITVDTSMCASTGMCESVAPELFEIGDDGALVVLQEVVPAELRARAEAAAQSCPTRALSLR